MKTQRLDVFTVTPKIMKGLLDLDKQISSSGLDMRLVQLVKIRASQMNGCSYCVDMHAKEARMLGEENQRLDVLAAWRESPAYTRQERAALAWTEALTRLKGEAGAADHLFETLEVEFNETEIAHLTVLIGMINIWNRLGTGFLWQHPVTVK